MTPPHVSLFYTTLYYFTFEMKWGVALVASSMHVKRVALQGGIFHNVHRRLSEMQRTEWYEVSWGRMASLFAGFYELGCTLRFALQTLRFQCSEADASFQCTAGAKKMDSVRRWYVP